MFGNRYEDHPDNGYLMPKEVKIGSEISKVAAERGWVTYYHVCESSTSSGLAEQVNRMLKQGYKLWGPMTHENKHLYQAMYK